MFLFNSQQSKELDRLSERVGVSVSELMENAGRAVALELAKRARPQEGSILVFAGKGNNGGDAKVAAKILEQKGFSVLTVPFESDLKKFSSEINKASWIVDGLLGTGIKGPAKGWIEEAIDTINAHGKKILAIDIPSGLSTDKGIPLGAAVKATVTVCLGGIKLGCFVHPGCEFAGEIVSADIGIPKEAYAKIASPFHATEPSDFKAALKIREVGGHKGDFGHVLVIGGSESMPGAGFLASQAALRSGCGMVTYCLPEAVYKKFDAAFAEVMVQPASFESIDSILKLCEKKQAVVLGPGLGRDPKTISFVKKIIPQIKLPLVLDADGLFAITEEPSILKKRTAPTILTPHIGEMATLLGWQTAEVEKAKVQVTQDSARFWNTIVILKGYRTLIGFSNGELFVNPTGNPGMATAGMGDVLAGILGGLLAQGLPAEKAALAGVYLHGLAGDMVAGEIGERGLIASDVSMMVPRGIKEMTNTK